MICRLGGLTHVNRQEDRFIHSSKAGFDVVNFGVGFSVVATQPRENKKSVSCAKWWYPYQSTLLYSGVTMHFSVF